MSASSGVNTENDSDLVRRFSGVSRLYGAAGLAQLQAMHICVVGIGGVGSWAAEALARNAVGRITLIDLDNIAESNVNRQLHAVDGAFGKAKVSAMATRIVQINPAAHVTKIEDFITPENIATLLNDTFDGIVDCIDDAKAKIAIAAFCKAQHIPLVMTGAAGGRLDPTRIRTADLSVVTHDKLLAKVRNGLRRDFGFAKGRDGVKQKQPSMHIPCVYSDELVIAPSTVNNQSADQACAIEADTTAEANKPITGLNCAGYGSSVCVTAPFGFAAVAHLLQLVLNNH